jgi:glycerol-3-phosphate acyltransferase PlsY
MEVLKILAICIGSYFIGSIPFGVIISKCKGVKIMEEGSGNIGGTNVGRTLGFGWGLFVGALDMIVKGTLPPIATAYYLNETSLITALSFLCASLGGFFSIWLKLKYGKFYGGKGVAVFLGGILILQGWQFWLGLFISALFMLFVYAKGKVSKVSLFIVTFVAVWSIVMIVSIPESWPTGLVIILVCGLIWWKHKENIERLIVGKEPGIKFVERFMDNPNEIFSEILDKTALKFQEWSKKLKESNGSKKPE